MWYIPSKDNIAENYAFLILNMGDYLDLNDYLYSFVCSCDNHLLANQYKKSDFWGEKANYNFQDLIDIFKLYNLNLLKDDIFFKDSIFAKEKYFSVDYQSFLFKHKLTEFEYTIGRYLNEQKGFTNLKGYIMNSYTPFDLVEIVQKYYKDDSLHTIDEIKSQYNENYEEVTIESESDFQYLLIQNSHLSEFIPDENKRCLYKLNGKIGGFIEIKDPFLKFAKVFIGTSGIYPHRLNDNSSFKYWDLSSDAIFAAQLLKEVKLQVHDKDIDMSIFDRMRVVKGGKIIFL